MLVIGTKTIATAIVTVFVATSNNDSTGSHCFCGLNVWQGLQVKLLHLLAAMSGDT